MLERWTLNFSPRSQHSGVQQPAIRLDTPAVYKRMVIALRSLYSYVRVLPAYRLFAACRVRRRQCRDCLLVVCDILVAGCIHLLCDITKWLLACGQCLTVSHTKPSQASARRQAAAVMLQRDGGANCSMHYRIALAPSPDVRSGASGRLQAYAFAPIDTPDGVFQMAVSHQVSTRAADALAAAHVCQGCCLRRRCGWLAMCNALKEGPVV
jgi:Autophagy-related protein 13